MFASVTTSVQESLAALAARTRRAPHARPPKSYWPGALHQPQEARKRWRVYPTLWSTKIFGTQLDFHAYTFFLALAFLIGTLLPVRQNYRQPNPYPITPIGGLWVFFGALIGAKMYWQVQYGDADDWLRVIRIWEGGLVFYGGLFGGILGALVYIRGVGAPVGPVGDMAIVYLPLAHGVARIGCLLNGCCWGSRTDLPWAIHYPRSLHGPYGEQLNSGQITAGTPVSLGVHPSQLYESMGLLCIFFILRYAYRRPHRTGEIVLLYPFCYGILRFLTEASRGDSARPFLAMTASQVVAIGFVAFALIGYAAMSLLVWPKPTPAAPSSGNSENESECR